MTKSEISSRLMDLAAKRFGADRTALKAADDFFETLGIDSLQAMDLLTDLEEAFDIEIPDYELQDVVTFDGLADLIAQRA
jgi:acyl carrier protein